REAVRRAIARLEGSFAVAVLFQKHTDRVYGARRNSPLVVGLANDSTFIASDVPAILSHTRRVIYLEEGEIVRIGRDGAALTTLAGRPVRRAPSEVSWTLEGAQKEGYAHFMLKEIHEQPKSLHSALTGRISADRRRVKLGTLGMTDVQVRRIRRVVFVACGTAWHAGLTAKYAVEELAGLPVDVALSSEFRYGNPVIDRSTLVVAISQSGETADTLAAIRLAREKGARVLCVCNVIGASIPRACHGTIYTQAGPEIGVASTKAYVTQIACLDLLAIHLACVRGRLKPAAAKVLLTELSRIPGKVERMLADDSAIRACAARYRDVPSFMYIGRRYNFPNAYEGALKLKEISYVHAEGYCAGEMKHGPLALVTPALPTVAICVESVIHEKMLSNIQEIKARGGILIAVANDGDEKVRGLSDVVLTVPKTLEIFSPIVTVVPLQLLAYHVAVARGCDVDQPRNLAKSVTVE
ncbi:MAG: glutamine--fructose-6-phosphate transaminase (isomerizing), partial [Planctomycetes bacterium]|nr:glutamine--fructose-6-phosphate transaminase (isomerizing) [Planctomycetota bacterium]